MEDMPHLETVYQAIYTLYHDPDCNEKSKANRWLMDLQKSIYAWKVADLLLQRPRDMDSCYFGAQMIRNKIMFNFHELPQEATLSLYNSLMQQLNNFTDDSNNIIITQLCVAVVDLSLQMSSWKNPIYTFLTNYNEIPHMVLLEILRIFPEELDTELMRLGSNRRNEIFDELCNCAGLMNDYLKEVVTRDQSKIVLLKAFRCFASWVTIGLSSISIILECELLPKAFQILTDPPDEAYDAQTNIESKLHDAATDVVCNFLKNLRDSQAVSVLDVNLYSKVAAFERAYHSSVASENTDKSANYCKIFSDLCEAFIPMMIDDTKAGNPHFSIKALDLVLICVGHHEYEVSLITFNFWFTISEVIYQKNDDDVTTEFKPYIHRLLTALCRQVQMEPDTEGLLEDGDEFKEFRDKVADLVKDVIFIVGSTFLFREMFHSIQNSNNLTWDQIEANLFFMHAVAKNIVPEKDGVVPEAVEAIFKLPESTHVAVKYTAILILGELCEWFDRHPTYLAAALELLAFCLQQNELSNAAAASMASICLVASVKLKENFDPLLAILRSLNSFNLTNESTIAIIKGVSVVISHLTCEQITVAVKETCWIQAHPLQQIIECQDLNVSSVKGTNADPVHWLDCLAAVFRFVDPKAECAVNPVTPAFSEVQPILFEIMEKFQTDVRVMERCCRCFRFAIRRVGKSGAFVIEPLIKKLVVLYSANRHSCFMYLGSVIVDEYGEDMSCWELIIQMVNAFTEPTLLLLKTPEGFRDHPDTIDDLFRLCSRILQRLPVAFLQSQTIWPLLECSLVAINLDHKEANASVMKFFHEMFDFTDYKNASYAPKKEAVQQIFEKHGTALVHNLLHASVLFLSAFTVSNVAEVLYDLIRFDSQNVIGWLHASIQPLLNQTSSGVLMASEEQIGTFLNNCERAATVKDVTRALKDFILYYR